MPEPQQLSDFRRHAEWALAVATAHDLGIPAALEGAGASAEQVAERLGLEPRAVRVLLGVLEGMGLAEREGARFRLREAGRRLLVDRSAPEFQGAALSNWRGHLRRWADELEPAARGERADEDAPAGTGGSREPEALARFMAAMDNKPPERVERVVDLCLERAPDARTVLDLGGGPGTFARAFARRGLDATLFDRPEVIRHVADAYGLRDHPRVQLQTGDFLQQPPEGPFDLVLVANITHLYDPETNARLLRRLAGSLAPGGVLAVLDFVRGASEFAPLFAVTMLLATQAGDTYTHDEYARWLEDAGLRDVRSALVDADRQLLTGAKQR